MISLYLISFISLLTQWTYASFIIFETKSEIDFNEDKRSLHLNNQYQYYTIRNVDIPGIWYNYDSIVNYIYLNGYINDNHSNVTERCQIIYSMSNLNNHEMNDNSSFESPSSNNATMPIPNATDKNKMNIVNLSENYTFIPKNSTSYSFEFQISKYMKINSTTPNDENISKKSTDNNKNNSTDIDESIKEENTLKVAINHSMKTSNENPSIKKLVKINSPILFINYNDIQKVGCSLHDIITVNHWNDIINTTKNSTSSININDELEKENSDEELDANNKTIDNQNSLTPSLLAFIVNEKELENIKRESNTNRIGMKYVKQSLASTIPITFISEKEYANLMNSLESKELWIQVTPAPTATTTFQYQNSTKIGHTIGLVGSIITFAYALFITISKLFKIDFTSSFHENFKFDLNSKMIILCFLSSLLFAASWIIKITVIYQEVAFITSPTIIYVKEFITNLAYLSNYISGSLYLSCLIEKFKGIKNVYFFIFIKATSFVLLPLIIIAHILFSSMNSLVMFYVSYGLNFLMIAILAVQGFLYLNTGRYIYNILKIYNEEQENKNSIPITDIDYFLEHHKLNKNTFNIAPSLCYLYFSQLISFLAYRSFYESGAGFWIILITQLLFINSCLLITLFIFSQKYNYYKINKAEEERLKELDNNKWYLASSSKTNRNINSISNSDTIIYTNSNSKLSNITSESSSIKSKSTMNTLTESNKEVKSSFVNYQNSNTSGVLINNNKSDSYYRNLYNMRKNNDNHDNLKKNTDSSVYSPSIKVPLTPLTKMKKLPYPTKSDQTSSAYSNKNINNYMTSSSSITTKKDDRFSQSSQPCDLDSYIINILNNYSSNPEDLTPPSHLLFPSATPPLINASINNTTTTTATATTEKSSPASYTYSSNNEYHFPSVFEQPPIDFTSRYRSLVSSIKPRNSYRDIYCKKIQENNIRNFNSRQNLHKSYDSLKNDQNQENVLLKKSISNLSIKTDSLPYEMANTSSKTIIQPNITKSNISDTDSSNGTIKQYNHSRTNSETSSTSTITQSNIKKTNSLTKSSNTKIPPPINTKMIISDSTPMSPKVEPEKKLKKLKKMKNKLLKGITTLTTTSPFEKDKESNDSLNNMNKHDYNKSSTLNYGSSPIRIEINQKKDQKNNDIPSNSTNKPLINNNNSTSLKKDNSTLSSMNNNKDKDRNSYYSSDSDSVYSLNFDLKAMSALINKSHEKKTSQQPRTTLNLTHVQVTRPNSGEKEKVNFKKLNLNNNKEKAIPQPKEKNTSNINNTENQALIAKTKSPLNMSNKIISDRKEIKIYGESREMTKVSNNKKNFINNTNKTNVDDKKRNQMNNENKPDYQKHHHKYIVLKDDRDDSEDESDSESDMLKKEYHNPRNFIVLKDQNENKNIERKKEPLKQNNNNSNKSYNMNIQESKKSLNIVWPDNSKDTNNNNYEKSNQQNYSPLKGKSKSMEYMKVTKSEKDNEIDTTDNEDEKDTKNKKLKKRRTFNNFKSFNYFDNKEDNFFSSPSSTPSTEKSPDTNTSSTSKPTPSNKAKSVPPKIKIIKKESTNFTKEHSPLSKVTTLNASPAQSISNTSNASSNSTSPTATATATTTSSSSNYSSNCSTCCSTCCNSDCSSCNVIDNPATNLNNHSNSKKTSQLTIPSSEETCFYDIVVDTEYHPSDQVTDTTLAENEIHAYSLPFLKLVENVKEKERELLNQENSHLTYSTPSSRWEKVPIINNREKRQVTIKSLSDYSDLDIPPSEAGALSYYPSNASSHSVKDDKEINSKRDSFAHSHDHDRHNYSTKDNELSPQTPPSTPHSFSSYTDNLWQKLTHSKTNYGTTTTTTTTITPNTNTTIPSTLPSTPTNALLKSPTSLKNLTTTFKNLTFPRSRKANEDNGSGAEEEDTKSTLTQPASPISPIKYINSFKI